MTSLINPTVTVIGLIYNKQSQITYFLDAIFRQTYSGPIELVLVDDFSQDNSVSVLESYIPTIQQIYSGKPIQIRIIKNHRNTGNCASRNKAIAASTGDIVIITDADCLLSKNFVESYVATYQREKCGVVVSSFGTELYNRDPINTLEFYEQDIDRVKKDCKVQDSYDPRSFLNTVTRGFSFLREYIDAIHYDENFNYTNSRFSGFGWEDIEVGCNLYQKGISIGHAHDAFSLHMTHHSTIEIRTKPLKSLRNFKKLHQKHPWLMSVKRDWSIRTYEKIVAWQIRNLQFRNDDNIFLEHHFSIRSQKQGHFFFIALKRGQEFLKRVFRSSYQNNL